METPKFDTYEELQAWLEEQDTSSNSNEESEPSKPSKKSTGKKKGSKKRSTSKKKPPPDEGTHLLNSPKPDETIWSTVHFYTQPGDNIASVRVDAKEEIGRRNLNVRAFYHDHLFGEACNNKCGEAV